MANPKIGGHLAGSQQVRGRWYTALDGLAGDRVEALHQDREGLLWVATADGGLSRFDSVEFDSFGANYGLPKHGAMAIAEGDGGELVVGYLNGGLAIREGTRFRRIGVEAGLPSPDVLGLRRLDDGSLLVCTGQGVVRLAGGRCIEPVTEVAGQRLGRVHDAIRDGSGRLWLASQVLGVVDEQGAAMRVGRDDGGGVARAWCFARDQAGGVWVGSRQSKGQAVLHHYDPAVDLAERVPGPFTGFHEAGVRHLRVDEDGRLWAGHRGAAVQDGREWQHVAPEHGLCDARVTFEDREGNLWVGLWGGGLWMGDPHSWRWYGRDDGLPGDAVTSLAADGSGRLWIGTTAGLARMEDGRLEEVFGEPVTSLEVDEDGRVWAGGDGAVWRCGSGLEAVAGEDPVGVVKALCADGTGRMWVGCSPGWLGVVVEGRLRTVRRHIADVSCLCDDGREGVWVGMYGHAPALCHLAREGAEPVPVEGLNANYAEAIQRRLDGQLWLATEHGLVEYDPKSQTVGWPILHSGLPRSAVTALTTDGQDRVWMGTAGNGVARLDEDGPRWLRTGTGPQANAVRAIAQDGAGRMWLGTRAGLALYRSRDTSPRILIRSVQAAMTYHEPSSVWCSEGVAEIRVSYQGICFGSGADSLRYRWRLRRDGAQAEWSSPSAAQTALLQNLRSGQYVFEVEALGFEGGWSVPAALHLRVDPEPLPVTQPSLPPLVGSSDAMRRVLAEVNRLADSDMTVLLQGETGVGKGLVARYLHQRSGRKGPLVVINCGGLSEGLAEAQLFGHEKGAFTGAHASRAGHFEQAAGGTLFLDEVGELTPQAQAALLHAVEDKQVRRIGAQAPTPVDVRLVTASNRDLAAAVEEGRFRQDLYYRLAQFAVTVPPLREHKEDVAELVEYFLGLAAASRGRLVPRVSPQAQRVLMEHDWPGNVRELDNVVRRAVLLSGDGPIWPEHVATTGPGTREKGRARQAASRSPAEQLAALADAERRTIETALEAAGGVVHGPRGAARLLGIPASRLRSWMQKHEVQGRGKAWRRSSEGGAT